ncbi:hypothetical protein [Pedobacter punctiformis]|uniref:SMODS-associating 2TM beta-strand rich effector domain-containing protein n=1 Tax=Pedobacter punctiformis TaxID=3004097 RepID=A0ABT4LA49_9SPHI|nr:hypothetical protein [Pedobacter sp. HCMS5-2]MCZ4244800.1 hypothetical protein [Pedobacter sp. HCMS5-2]
MKTVYRIFSKVWFLNIIAMIMMLFTLQFAVIGIISIAENRIKFYLNDNFLGVILFVIILIVDIWILTATFLPIIKINDYGIFAYSIFWKRRILWAEMKSAKLLKTKNRHSTGRASVDFEFTKEPETKNNALTNNGLRVNTFIIISKKLIKKPENLSLSIQLLNHKKITTIEEIAFEYEEEAWKIIQNKLNE